MRPNRLLLFPLLLVIAVPAAAAAAAGPKPPTVLPFLSRNNHLLVRGTVNASDSLWFIVDTGAGGNVLNQSTAKRLGLAVTPGVQAHGAGGPAQGGRIERATIRVAGFAIEDPSLVALDLDLLAIKTGHPCDGILGAPFWKSAVVTIDYAASTMTLHDPGGYRPPAGSAALEISFERAHPYVDGRLTLPGGEPVEGRFVIDTGSAMSLILAPGFVEKEKAMERVRRTLRTVMGGVGGQSEAPMGRIGSLELGPFALEAPIAILRPPGAGHTSIPGSIGNIGGDVLRRFRVTFDYGRKRMHLEKAASFAEPFEADMSGLVLSAREDGSGSIDVLLVQEDSPAKELGIRPGDTLASFDGDAVTPAGLYALRRALKSEGRSVRLGLVRDGVTTERTLVTRRLL